MYVCMYVPELRHTGRKPLLQLQQPMQCVPVVTGDLVAVSCAVEEDPYTGHWSIDLAGEGRGGGGKEEGEEEGKEERKTPFMCHQPISRENANYLHELHKYIHMYEFRLEWHIRTYVNTYIPESCSWSTP